MNETPAISTEGRVFVAQLTRDLARRERAGASALSPGTTKWREAMRSFAVSVIEQSDGSPVKAAKLFRTALDRIRIAQTDGACYVNCFMRRSRSAFFEILTYEVAPHPLTLEGYDGILVRSYQCMLRRNGRIAVGGASKLAFVSWHALARMKERSNADILFANVTVAICGIAGVLMRRSDKHLNTEINVAHDNNMLCTGVLRHAINDEDGRRYTFFDVLTVLPLDEVHDAKRKQGIAIGHAAYRYIQSDDADPAGYADKIAVLPFNQNDYVSREIRKVITK